MKNLMFATALALVPTFALADGPGKHVAIHVNQNDAAVMNMALNNAQNVAAHYEAMGEAVYIELVAYGPGLNMFVPGKSPVEQRISTMSLEMDTMAFTACGNTHRKMSEKAGKDVPLMSEAVVVPSGVVRLIDLQDAGYAYVRP